MIIVKKCLAVIAQSGLTGQDQGGDHTGPVGVGPAGQFLNPDHDLPGFVPPQIPHQHFQGGFKMLVPDLECFFPEPFGIPAAHPFPHGRCHAEPCVFFHGLV